MRLSIDLELDEKWVKTLETIKALLITNPETGITQSSGLSEVFCACADAGVATLAEQMMLSGEWEKYAAEVELGDAIDDILRGTDKG